MSEKSREEEKLSFKEQILRDLERVKKHEEDQEEVDLASIKPQFSSKNEPVNRRANGRFSISCRGDYEKKLLPCLPTQVKMLQQFPSHPSQEVPASPVDESIPRPDASYS